MSQIADQFPRPAFSFRGFNGYLGITAFATERTALGPIPPGFEIERIAIQLTGNATYQLLAIAALCPTAELTLGNLRSGTNLLTSSNQISSTLRSMNINVSLDGPVNLDLASPTPCLPEQKFVIFQGTVVTATNPATLVVSVFGRVPLAPIGQTFTPPLARDTG